MIDWNSKVMVQVKDRRRTYIKVTCSLCNSERLVSPENARRIKTDHCAHCSQKLKKPENYKGTVKPCLNCQREVYVYPFHVNSRTFCSRRCFCLYNRLDKTIKEEPGTPQIRTCAQCGKLFETPIASKAWRCCSVKCSAIYRTHKFTKTCVTCGKEYEVGASRLDSQFCSRKCAAIGIHNPTYKHGRYAGKNRVYYPWTWKRTRDQIVKRDNHQCQSPGCNETKRLHVHHIIGVRNFSSFEEATTPENLITYCIFHHQEQHRIRA